jgi:hypothetical protein
VRTRARAKGDTGQRSGRRGERERRENVAKELVCSYEGGHRCEKRRACVKMENKVSRISESGVLESQAQAEVKVKMSSASKAKQSRATTGQFSLHNNTIFLGPQHTTHTPSIVNASLSYSYTTL